MNKVYVRVKGRVTNFNTDETSFFEIYAQVAKRFGKASIVSISVVS